MLSRNDLCWCGSQKKYKKCHLAQDEKLDLMAKKGVRIPGREMIKTEEDIIGIKAACQISKKILDTLNSELAIGVNTNHIDKLVDTMTRDMGAYPAPLNYKGFPKSCCISVNEVICHGIPGDWQLNDGDIVNIDVTSYFNGYYGDVSRMFMIGDVDKEAKKLVEIAYECMMRGIEQVKPYNRLGDIAYAISEHAHYNNYSVVRDYGGHGIGKGFHEEPFVPHCGDQGTGMLLVPNLVFTIEPMINIGKEKCELLSDNWTVVTADRKLTAQWEHTVRVSESGFEILSA